MNLLEKASRVFEIEIEELRALKGRLNSTFEGAVTAMKIATEMGRKVVIVGIGKNSYIGEKIAATLTSTGSPSLAMNSMNALHGDLGIVQDGDVVVALSYSGETEELISLVGALRRFEVKVVAVTGRACSTLAKHSDLVLDVSVNKEACPLELAPTSSTTSMLVLGDALAMVLLEIRGFQREDFAKFHPGGSLGRKLLTTAEDMMRTLDETVLAAPENSVQEVVENWSNCKAGAAIVVHPNSDKLAGIFTHGDFVRAFRREGGGVSRLKVKELMTREPITIRSDRLAMEVVSVLKQHRIDEIIVVNSADRPVGLIDVQDLTRLKLL